MKSMMIRVSNTYYELKDKYEGVRHEAQTLSKKNMIFGFFLGLFLTLGDSVFAQAGNVAAIENFLTDRIGEFKGISTKFIGVFGIIAFIAIIIFILRHDYGKAVATVVVFLVCVSAGTLLSTLTT